ncbi:hypothetical protein AX15_000753 [Amanita polypyramis BW_CC]|nr:hypothetical protein AX15_000753 [Amanita polypyramis BW_CC]
MITVYCSAVLAGGSPGKASFPGPVIRGLKGNNFKLNVTNSLMDPRMLRSTSIHWHGLLQRSSAWADGSVGVTQCPIVPGNSFLYEFQVPDQAGTFWYHSHYSTQYCDGLRGAFVVYDLLDPHRTSYDIDDESTIITLADWYHAPSPHTAAYKPTPNSTLINGKGRYVGGPLSPLAEITIIPGLRYRFRLVSISCSPNYVFAIDGHNLTVVEVDGVNVEPVTVNSIQIFAGQRYSFILHADQSISNYWIRARPNEGYQGFDNGLNSAILRYLPAAGKDPITSETTETNTLKETDLHPLDDPRAPGQPFTDGADVAINLDIGFAPGHFYINGASFEPPNVPVLLQILSGKSSAQDLLPTGSVFVLPPNKVIELTIPGFNIGGPHPFHLHGHTFSVVRSAGSTIYNYENPVRRDVVSVGDSTDNVTIRFTTDNAGPWFFHCHIEWHLQAGLAIVFTEDVQTIAKSTHPVAWDELCPEYAQLPPEL